MNYGTAVVERLLEHAHSGYLVVEQVPPLNPDTLAAELKRAPDLFGVYARRKRQ